MTKEVPRTSVLRDEELIARLRSVWRYKDLHLCPEAADRIEALVKEKDQEYKDNIVRMAGQAKDFMEEISTLKARIEALSISNATLIAERDQWIAHAKNAIWSDSEQLRLAEAKLAALVDAAEKVINSYWNSTDGVITGIYDLETALAEIKSGIATTPYGLEGENHE